MRPRRHVGCAFRLLAASPSRLLGFFGLSAQPFQGDPHLLVLNLLRGCVPLPCLGILLLEPAGVRDFVSRDRDLCGGLTTLVELLLHGSKEVAGLRQAAIRETRPNAKACDREQVGGNGLGDRLDVQRQ
jgi:hypothetical protein